MDIFGKEKRTSRIEVQKCLFELSGKIASHEAQGAPLPSSIFLHLFMSGPLRILSDSVQASFTASLLCPLSSIEFQTSFLHPFPLYTLSDLCLSLKPF